MTNLDKLMETLRNDEKLQKCLDLMVDKANARGIKMTPEQRQWAKEQAMMHAVLNNDKAMGWVLKEIYERINKEA